ncbi:MAG TPA: isochorismatase family protein [Bacteroidales bacterium]|nr:isochorismatase family protein [Bacteroidales bacterium]
MDKTTLSKGIRPALLVIDVQNRYMVSISQRDREIGIYFINLLIELFRENNFPVIRIYHTDEVTGPLPQTEEFEFHSGIRIKQDDTMIIKTYPDSFNKTILSEELNKSGINTVFLCGQSAVGCVLATRTGARNNDLNVFMVKDAIMCHNTEYTRNIEMMFDAVSYDVVKFMLENC